MNFSPEWDRRYRERTNMSLWPWSDLVSYVMHYVPPNWPSMRVLELGCGAGANIPFFVSLGAEYRGIDGSTSIVENLRGRFPTLKDNIVCGDFTVEIPIEGEFDLVVDRGSLTCNAHAAVVDGLNLVHAKLKPGGMYVGIDWFSTDYSEMQRGTAAEDNYTRASFVEGPLADTGRAHFSDKSHMLDLFRRFEIIVLEHKTVRRDVPDDGWNFASWNLAARK